MQSYRYEAKRLASCLTSRGKKIISKHGFGGDLISLSYDDEANHGHRIVKIAHKKADLHIANAIEQVALQIHIYMLKICLCPILVEVFKIFTMSNCMNSQ